MLKQNWDTNFSLSNWKRKKDNIIVSREAMRQTHSYTADRNVNCYNLSGKQFVSIYQKPKILKY